MSDLDSHPPNLGPEITVSCTSYIHTDRHIDTKEQVIVPVWTINRTEKRTDDFSSHRTNLAGKARKAVVKPSSQ